MSDKVKPEPKTIIPYNEQTVIIYETLARIARRIIQEQTVSKTA